MKVLYDSQIFNAQQYGGISRYYANLAKELHHIEDVTTSILAPTYINNYLPHISEYDRVFGFKSKVKWQSTSRVFSHMACHLAIPLLGPDIIHKTYYYPERYPKSFGRSVLTVYDMIHELFPENFSSHDRTSNYKYKAVKRADHVICISENTKSDLLRLWDINPDKVSVVHLGFDSFTAQSNQPMTSNNDRLKDYILFVGARKGHKNFERVLKAYSSKKALSANFSLICFGGGSFNLDEEKQLKNLGLTNKVIQMSGSDVLLANLYQNADLFIYPSLYEGFGIPPLEAMSAGCPVAAAKISCIPEVCGSAVEYFDPYDINSIALSLERVLGDSKYKENLSSLGYEQSDNFSWQKCAVETLEKYSLLY